MDELAELYQQVIIDHGTKPRNQGVVVDPTYQAEGYNPLCGDQLSLSLKMQDHKIIEAKFVGEGCAISTASASLLTQFLIDKTIEDVQTAFSRFIDMLTQSPKADYADLGKLSIFAGVNKYPARVKCATLAWHTLKAALDKNTNAVSTE